MNPSDNVNTSGSKEEVAIPGFKEDVNTPRSQEVVNSPEDLNTPSSKEDLKANGSKEERNAPESNNVLNLPASPSPSKHIIPTSHQRVILIVAMVTVAGFLGPVAGNIYVPLLPLYKTVFNASTTTVNGTVSVFMFTFGIAPLFWASLADKYGRRPLYLLSFPFYILSAILLSSLPPNIVSLYILRVVQAFGASSLVSLGAATISDIVDPKHRAKAISYFLLGPQLGPIVGLVASLVGSGGQWRWTFGILSILGGLAYAAILWLLPETLRRLVDLEKTDLTWRQYILPAREAFSVNIHCNRIDSISVFRLVAKVLLYFLILWCSLIGAFLFASFYSLTVSFSSVLKSNYHFSQAEVSVSYLCPSIALISGSLIAGRVSDFLQVKGVNLDKSPHHPERRLLIQTAGLIVCIGGLSCFGWAIHFHWHVVSLFFFSFMISFGMSAVSVVNMTYMSECPTGYISTNVAVGNMARNLAAGVASLVIDILTEKMGYGWCFTGLALLNVASVGMSLVLCKYGHRWNQRHEEKRGA